MYKDTQKNCPLFTLSWGESMVEVGEKGLHFVHIQFWGTCFLWRIYPNKQQSLLWYSPPCPTSHNQLSFQFTYHSYGLASCNKDILVRIALCHTTIGLSQRRKGKLNDASRCFSLSWSLVPGESLVSQDLGTGWTQECSVIYKDLGTAGWTQQCNLPLLVNAQHCHVQSGKTQSNCFSIPKCLVHPH